MRFLIYDPGNRKLGQLQNTSSIQWKPRYNERGTAEIHAYPTPDNEKFLIEGNRVVCVERKEILFISDVESDDKSIIINGYMDNLSDRINLETATIKKVKRDIYELVNNNARGLAISTSAEIGDDITLVSQIETTYDELIETIMNVCQNALIGFRTLFIEATGENKLDIYSGSVKNQVRFSDRLGNVLAQKYIRQMSDYKNRAYVYGEGDGESRVNIIVDLISDDEPVKEMYVDARDLQSENYKSESEYIQALRDRGIKKLLETQKSCRQFSFELVQNSISGVFGKDYDIGDVVPVISTKYGLKAYARIAGANFIEEDGKENKTTLEVELERQDIE